jgi:hypothetical protein
VVELNEPFVAFNSKMDELKSWMRNQRFDVASQKQVEEFYAGAFSSRFFTFPHVSSGIVPRFHACSNLVFQIRQTIEDEAIRRLHRMYNYLDVPRMRGPEV